MHCYALTIMCYNIKLSVGKITMFLPIWHYISYFQSTTERICGEVENTALRS